MFHEFLPCHMRHPEPYQKSNCFYGHCLACDNHHCAFDLCVPNASGILGLEEAQVFVPFILKPGQPEYERAKQSMSLN